MGPKDLIALLEFIEFLESMRSARETITVVPQPTEEGSDATMATKDGNTLESAANALVQKVEIVQHDGPIMIPLTLSLENAAKALLDRVAALEKDIRLFEDVAAFPWDAAIALKTILLEMYGWVPPTDCSVSIEVDYNKTAHIPWGKFKIPGIEGMFNSSVSMKDGVLQTRYIIDVKGKHEAAVRAIFEKVRAYLRTNSIYRGKAFSVSFFDADGEKHAIPEIKFMDVSSVDESKLIFSRDVEALIDANLFTPIRRVKELARNDIPIKRGTLLHGRFGTGKTLAAAIAAKLALAQGMTYIYVPKAGELAEAIAFSKPYQEPAVLIFAEDIDRPMSGPRVISTDDILNTIDGINSKNSNVMIVLTSNDVDSIEPALLRPGRLDAVIEVTAPDAEAAGRLVALYGGPTLAHDINLTDCGQALSGMIPAVVAEVLQRAKLTQLRLTPVGQLVDGIGTEAIVLAAETMKKQLELINRTKAGPTAAEQTIADFGALLRADEDEIREQRRLAAARG